MTTPKQSLHLSLTGELSAALESAAQTSGMSKSAIVDEALRWWIANGEHDAADQPIEAKLDHLASRSERIGQVLDEFAKALNALVLYELTRTAHLPPFTPEATHLGRLRYRAFIDTVGRNLAKGGGAAFAGTDLAPGAIALDNEFDPQHVWKDDDHARDQ